MAVLVISSRSVGQVQSDVLPKAQISTVYAAEDCWTMRAHMVCFLAENTFQLHWKEKSDLDFEKYASSKIQKREPSIKIRL